MEQQTIEQQTVVPTATKTNDEFVGLKPGEQYLSIDLSGLTLEMIGKIILGEKIPIWPNRNKTEDKHPDFKARGIAVWLSTKR